MMRVDIETSEDRRLDAVWCATFGASIARHVHDRIEAGHGPPQTDNDWGRIAEEAEAIADEARSLARAFPGRHIR